MSIRKKACFVIIGAFSVLLCSFLSLNVSAIDASINLNDYEVVPISVDPDYYDYVFDSPNYSCSQTFNCTFRYGARLKQASTHAYYDLKKDDILTYQLYIFSTSSVDALLTNLQVRPITPGYGASLVYIHQVSDSNLFGDISSAGYNTGVVYEIAIKYERDGSYRLGSFNTNTIDIVLDGGLNNPNAYGATIAITGFSLYRYKGSDAKRAIDNQTQQQQNQYNQEKQEESQRENQANGDSSSAQGLFNFNVLNPFANLWSAFNSSGCVSIPIIAGMLHSSSTTYCPWFPSSVRSVVTPVMAIASSMLLFGFVVRWLSGNSGDIYGARNMNKELNG